MPDYPALAQIRQASKVIAPYAHRTSIMTSSHLNDIVGGSIFFKCENFQKVGAFKFRGATNAIFSLSDTESKKGVATASSGNHGAAVALAARLRGIKAHVIMPNNAPLVKKEAVAGYGAQIVFCEPKLQARQKALDDTIERTSATLIHAYDDPRIIAGQGTAALELIEDAEPLDMILAPVGGGGLLGGTAVAAKGLDAHIQVIGCEPERADDAYQSFVTGVLTPSDDPDTVADGLLTSLGQMNFNVIRDLVDDIVTVSEQAIVQAMRTVWERMKIIIEPSSAVPLAALMSGKVDGGGRRIGVIVSGGNVDLERLPWQRS